MTRLVALLYVIVVLAWRLGAAVVGLLRRCVRLVWALVVVIVLWMGHGVADVIDFFRPPYRPLGERRPR